MRAKHHRVGERGAARARSTLSSSFSVVRFLRAFAIQFFWCVFAWAVCSFYNSALDVRRACSRVYARICVLLISFKSLNSLSYAHTISSYTGVEAHQRLHKTTTTMRPKCHRPNALVHIRARNLKSSRSRNFQPKIQRKQRMAKPAERGCRRSTTKCAVAVAQLIRCFVCFSCKVDVRSIALSNC